MKKVKLLIFIGLAVLGQVIMILSVVNLYNESNIYWNSCKIFT